MQSNRWYISNLTFPELLHRNVTRFGANRAQWWRNQEGVGTSITYEELGEIVKHLSSGLISLGVKRGDRIALMAHTCPAWMWADYAILCAAGITVPIYPTLSAQQMTYIINDSNARLIFMQNDMMLSTLKNAWHLMPNLEAVVMLEDRISFASPHILTLNQLLAKGRKELANNSQLFEKRWRSVNLSDVMTIVYTSGTTGEQKGVVHSHASVNAACCRDLTAAPKLSEDDILLSFLPLAHTYERECGHGTAMMAALTIAYSSPNTLARDLVYFKPTYFMSVPRIYERIYRTMRDKAASSRLKSWLFKRAMRIGLDVMDARADEHGFVNMSEGINFTAGLNTWLSLKYRLFDMLVFKKVRALLGGRFRFAYSAAGSLSANLCKIFMAMGIRIFEGYGSTETCNTVNLNPSEKVLPGSVGPLAPHVQGRIAADGEWMVRGNNLFLEYWKRPDKTNEAFTDDGFYKTGDIVEVLQDGYIRLIDRKSGLIVLDTGKNIPTAKIEHLFNLSDFIDIIVAIGNNKPYVVALVTLNFDRLIEYFAKHDIPYDRNQLVFSQEDGTNVCKSVGNDFIGQKHLKKMVAAEIEEANKKLETYERIKRYKILPRRFTVASGELTPTLKIRRRIIIDRFQEEIDSLYTTTFWNGSENVIS